MGVDTADTQSDDTQCTQNRWADRTGRIKKDKRKKKTLKKCIEYKRQQHNDDEGKNPKTSWPEYYIV